MIAEMALCSNDLSELSIDALRERFLLGAGLGSIEEEDESLGQSLSKIDRS